MLMSVCLVLTNATRMLHVIILMDRMDVHVMLDTVEMVSIVQVNYDKDNILVSCFESYSKQ